MNSDAPSSISVTSSAFAPDASIPEKYSCHGANVSPPLAWSGVSDAALELALVMDDPDAPRGTYTHWILFGMRTSLTSLDEATIPDGSSASQELLRRCPVLRPMPAERDAPLPIHHLRAPRPTRSAPPARERPRH